jgi:hypothetical protein
MRKPDLKSFAAGLVVGAVALVPVAAGALAATPTHVEAEIVNTGHGLNLWVYEGANWKTATTIECPNVAHQSALAKPDRYAFKTFWSTNGTCLHVVNGG